MMGLERQHVAELLSSNHQGLMESLRKMFSSVILRFLEQREGEHSSRVRLEIGLR